MKFLYGFPVLAVSAAIAASSILTACGQKDEVFTLSQRVSDPVELTLVDVNPKGDSGDVKTFVADLYRGDQPYGSVMGTITKVGSIGKGSRLDREENLLAAVYDLPDGQISAMGISYYLKGANLLPEAEPVTRAIVGGTGKYVGVDGEVTTSRNSDNSYTHILRIKK